MEPCKKCSVSRAIHCISLRVPSKGDLPPCSPHRAPIDGNTSFTELSFTVRVPGKGPPPPSPKRPYGERGPFPEPSFTYPSVSPEWSPPSRFPLQSSPRERERERPISGAHLHLSLKVPVKPAPLNRAPMKRAARFQSRRIPQ